MAEQASSHPISKPASFLLIDLLKTVAALLIIFHHLANYGQIAKDAQSYLPGFMRWLSNYGSYAVELFLVMAGYLATQSLTRFAHIPFSVSGYTQAIINRYIRLLGPYVVALLITIACAYIARLWISDEYVGATETFTQFLAHLFLLQGMLGIDSISAGVWYIAIDWQLYAILTLLLMSYSNYRVLIWSLIALLLGSLLFFNRSADFDNYFIYFIGYYGLGVLAYLARGFADDRVNRLAQAALILLGFIILLASFFGDFSRSALSWFVAMALLFWGNRSYPVQFTHRALNVGHGDNDRGNTSSGASSSSRKPIFFKAIGLGGKLSYCAFLIHFPLILLANTLYIASGIYSHESGLFAISLMLGVLVCTVLSAHCLYQWVELPISKYKIQRPISFKTRKISR
jgi:peptidoglycan/LPS O-acetylase OafA/YrhL